MSASLLAITTTITTVTSSNGFMRMSGAPQWRSGRLTLQARAADGERDLDVAARGPRVRAGLVGQAHQFERLVTAEPWRFQVERRRETEAAAFQGTDPDARGDPRAAQIELPPRSEAQQRRLEARGLAGREELLRVGPWPARAAHLGRNVEVDVDAPVARAGVTFATARGRCLGGVEDLGLVAHPAFSFAGCEARNVMVSER
jgi:hypothetical protein